MKYQALKQLKTKSKLLKMCDTLKEAHDLLTGQEKATFRELSYIGQFPVYSNGKNTYSIQGAFMLENGSHVVCGLDKEDVEYYKITFNN